MRLGLLLLVLFATLFGSGFWYDYIDTTCKIPIHYRIGTIDERFGTSKEEIKDIVSRAEAVWESELSTELFVYDESEKSLPVNLVFDERQETAERESELRDDIDAKEGMSESVALQYERLISEFRSFKKKYETRVVSYENSLKEYNIEVTEWNNKGGAPQNIIDELKKKEQTLTKEQGELELLAKQLNTIVSDLNRIGARGNELITDYNSIVEKYNTEFSEGREFAQGEYTQDAINIYQFDSEDELVIVFAHEFGHALSLGHVAGESSIMYHLMGSQTITGGIEESDRVAFEETCKQKTFLNKVFSFLKDTFAL